MKTTNAFFHPLLLAGALLASTPAAHAIDFTPDAASLRIGAGSHGTSMAGVGIVWDWDFERLRRKAELTAHTEFMVNTWRADAVGGGTQTITQLALLPSLRMTLSQGRSPWFIELGVGISWMDRLFVTPQKRFSTQWNFYDMMGVGYQFGANRGHELGLRWAHVSNAGLKKPNPGQDFLQLRYVARF
jgi:lipid A 3-O-deacylase